MPYCGETSLVKHQGPLRTVTSLRCRSWKCPDCVDGRRRRLIAELLGGQPGVMLTLTHKPQPGQSVEEAAAALSHAWRLLRLRAMRHYNLTKLPFMAVFEATKLGRPHLHILLRVKWLDQQWLSTQMDDIIQSPVVHIRRLDSKGRAAAYVAKYCGKSPHQFAKCKRYWKSQDYEQRPKDSRLKHCWWLDTERLNIPIAKLFHAYCKDAPHYWLSPFRFVVWSGAGPPPADFRSRLVAGRVGT